MITTKQKIISSFIYPLLFVAILWSIKVFEILSDTSFAEYGLNPRTLQGLLGILTEPLLHADIKHLAANSLPLIILGTIIFYFYRSIAFQIFFWVYLSTGLWVWTAARSSYHIGASGIIYGFESFVFFSGVFRKNTGLQALSLLVVLLYGSTVWGMFPVEKHISWESHALGALAGFITAYYFRNEGPKNQTYDFGDDAENEKLIVDENGEPLYKAPEENNNDVVINYEYIERKNNDIS